MQYNWLSSSILFGSSRAGASDAEESVLQDLEPIEPDEVLDLVDAQSASESADAVIILNCFVPVLLSCPWLLCVLSELCTRQQMCSPTAVHAVQSDDSDAELEAASSRPIRPACALIPVFNKAKPLVNDTKHAAAEPPSLLYPLRPTKWRPPVLLAHLNAAAAIASANSELKVADSSGVHTFPLPVFAKPPPPVALQPAPPSNVPDPKDPCQDACVPPARLGIPPPCEPNGEDGWDWSVLSASLYPASPAKPSFQPPSRPTSKPLQMLSCSFISVSRPTASPGSTGNTTHASLRSSKQLQSVAAGYAAATAPANTPQWACTAAANLPASVYAPHVAAPLPRTDTPGAAPPQHCSHQQAPSPPQHPGQSYAPRAAPEAVYQQQQDAVLAMHSQPGPPGHRAHLAAPQFSPVSAPDNLQTSAPDTSPYPIATQAPSVTCTSPGTGCPEAPHSCAAPQLGVCGVPAAPVTSEQNAEDARDPLNDLLGEIDQFILNQHGACMLPDAPGGLLPAPDPHPPCASPTPQLHAGDPGGATGAPSNGTYPVQTPAGLSLTVTAACHSNDAAGPDFVPIDADFQPLTPRTPRSATGGHTPPDLSPADWEAVFPGVSPIVGATEGAWGLEGTASPYLSPELSLLSPILQRALHPVACEAAVLRSGAAAGGSPAVWQSTGGAGVGVDAVGGIDLNRDTMGSHASLASCGAQDMQPQADVCGVRRGGGGGAPCGAHSRGGTDRGRPWPPVARRLDLDVVDASCKEKREPPACQSDQSLHVLDPFTSGPFPEDAELDVNQDRNGSNQCSCKEQAESPLQPQAAGDALQELLDEVDAAVASGLQPLPGSPPTLSAVLHATDPCNTTSFRVHQVVGGQTDRLGEQQAPHGETVADTCDVQADAAAEQQSECAYEHQSTDPTATAQNPGESVTNSAQDTVHEVSVDRGGVREMPGDDSENAGGAAADTAAASDGACMGISPDCFDDLGDDELYRLCASPLAFCATPELILLVA